MIGMNFVEIGRNLHEAIGRRCRVGAAEGLHWEEAGIREISRRKLQEGIPIRAENPVRRVHHEFITVAAAILRSPLRIAGDASDSV